MNCQITSQRPCVMSLNFPWPHSIFIVNIIDNFTLNSYLFGTLPPPLAMHLITYLIQYYPFHSQTILRSEPAIIAIPINECLVIVSSMMNLQPKIKSI